MNLFSFELDSAGAPSNLKLCNVVRVSGSSVFFTPHYRDSNEKSSGGSTLDFETLSAAPVAHRQQLQHHGVVAKISVGVSFSSSVAADYPPEVHQEMEDLLYSPEGRLRLWHRCLSTSGLLDTNNDVRVPSFLSHEDWPLLSQAEYEKRVRYYEGRQKCSQVQQSPYCAPILDFFQTQSHVPIAVSALPNFSATCPSLSGGGGGGVSTAVSAEKSMQDGKKDGGSRSHSVASDTPLLAVNTRDLTKEKNLSSQSLMPSASVDSFHLCASTPQRKTCSRYYYTVSMCVIWMPFFPTDVIQWSQYQFNSGRWVAEQKLISMIHQITTGLHTLEQHLSPCCVELNVQKMNSSNSEKSVEPKVEIQHKGRREDMKGVVQHLGKEMGSEIGEDKETAVLSSFTNFEMEDILVCEVNEDPRFVLSVSTYANAEKLFHIARDCNKLQKLPFYPYVAPEQIQNMRARAKEKRARRDRGGARGGVKREEEERPKKLDSPSCSIVASTTHTTATRKISLYVVWALGMIVYQIACGTPSLSAQLKRWNKLRKENLRMLPVPRLPQEESQQQTSTDNPPSTWGDGPLPLPVSSSSSSCVSGSVEFYPLNHPLMTPDGMVARVRRDLESGEYSPVLVHLLSLLLSGDAWTRPKLSTLSQMLPDLNRSVPVLRFPFALGSFDVLLLPGVGEEVELKDGVEHAEGRKMYGLRKWTTSPCPVSSGDCSTNCSRCWDDGNDENGYKSISPSSLESGREQSAEGKSHPYGCGACSSFWEEVRNDGPFCFPEREVKKQAEEEGKEKDRGNEGGASGMNSTFSSEKKDEENMDGAHDSCLMLSPLGRSTGVKMCFLYPVESPHLDEKEVRRIFFHFFAPSFPSAPESVVSSREHSYVGGNSINPPPSGYSIENMHLMRLFQICGGFAVLPTPSIDSPPRTTVSVKDVGERTTGLPSQEGQKGKETAKKESHFKEVLILLPRCGVRRTDPPWEFKPVHFTAALPWPSSCTAVLQSQGRIHSPVPPIFGGFSPGYSTKPDRRGGVMSTPSSASTGAPANEGGILSRTAPAAFSWILPGESFSLPNRQTFVPAVEGGFVFWFHPQLLPTDRDRYFALTSVRSMTHFYRVPRTVMPEKVVVRHDAMRDFMDASWVTSRAGNPSTPGGGRHSVGAIATVSASPALRPSILNTSKLTGAGCRGKEENDATRPSPSSASSKKGQVSMGSNKGNSSGVENVGKDSGGEASLSTTVASPSGGSVSATHPPTTDPPIATPTTPITSIFRNRRAGLGETFGPTAGGTSSCQRHSPSPPPIPPCPSDKSLAHGLPSSASSPLPTPSAVSLHEAAIKRKKSMVINPISEESVDAGITPSVSPSVTGAANCALRMGTVETSSVASTLISSFPPSCDGSGIEGREKTLHMVPMAPGLGDGLEMAPLPSHHQRSLSPSLPPPRTLREESQGRSRRARESDTDKKGGKEMEGKNEKGLKCAPVAPSERIDFFDANGEGKGIALRNTISPEPDPLFPYLQVPHGDSLSSITHCSEHSGTFMATGATSHTTRRHHRLEERNSVRRPPLRVKEMYPTEDSGHCVSDTTIEALERSGAAPKHQNGECEVRCHKEPHCVLPLSALAQHEGPQAPPQQKQQLDYLEPVLPPSQCAEFQPMGFYDKVHSHDALFHQEEQGMWLASKAETSPRNIKKKENEKVVDTKATDAESMKLDQSFAQEVLTTRQKNSEEEGNKHHQQQQYQGVKKEDESGLHDYDPLLSSSAGAMATMESEVVIPNPPRSPSLRGRKNTFVPLLTESSSTQSVMMNSEVKIPRAASEEKNSETGSCSVEARRKESAHEEAHTMFQQRKERHACILLPPTLSDEEEDRERSGSKKEKRNAHQRTEDQALLPATGGTEHSLFSHFHHQCCSISNIDLDNELKQDSEAIWHSSRRDDTVIQLLSSISDDPDGRSRGVSDVAHRNCREKTITIPTTPVSSVYHHVKDNAAVPQEFDAERSSSVPSLFSFSTSISSLPPRGPMPCDPRTGSVMNANPSIALSSTGIPGPSLLPLLQSSLQLFGYWYPAHVVEVQVDSLMFWIPSTGEYGVCQPPILITENIRRALRLDTDFSLKNPTEIEEKEEMDAMYFSFLASQVPLLCRDHPRVKRNFQHGFLLPQHGLAIFSRQGVLLRILSFRFAFHPPVTISCSSPRSTHSTSESREEKKKADDKKVLLGSSCGQKKESSSQPQAQQEQAKKEWRDPEEFGIPLRVHTSMAGTRQRFDANFIDLRVNSSALSPHHARDLVQRRENKISRPHHPISRNDSSDIRRVSPSRDVNHSYPVMESSPVMKDSSCRGKKQQDSNDPPSQAPHSSLLPPFLSPRSSSVEEALSPSRLPSGVVASVVNEHHTPPSHGNASVHKEFESPPAQETRKMESKSEGKVWGKDEEQEAKYCPKIVNGNHDDGWINPSERKGGETSRAEGSYMQENTRQRKRSATVTSPVSYEMTPGIQKDYPQHAFTVRGRTHHSHHQRKRSVDISELRIGEMKSWQCAEQQKNNNWVKEVEAEEEWGCISGKTPIHQEGKEKTAQRGEARTPVRASHMQWSGSGASSNFLVLTQRSFNTSLPVACWVGFDREESTLVLGSSMHGPWHPVAFVSN